jgi:hypothetical protein
VRHDQPDSPLPPDLLISKQNLNLHSHISMEYWEITKERAQKTLAPWNQYIADVKINGKAPEDLAALIAGFAPLVAARVVAQDEYDDAFRAVQGALLKMKLLSLRVAGMIENQLDEDAGLMAKIDKLRRVNPRTGSTILKRAGELVPIWKQANAALAALADPQPALVRTIQGQAWTVAMLETLVAAGYDALVAALNAKEEALDNQREDLHTHDAVVDRLNKNWYGYVKNSYDAGSEIYEALSDIPTEPSTPVPEVIEIATVTQGGEEGRQALVSYAPGGGAHATSKKVKWKVDGVDADFGHEAPLDASGNALGPFEVGQVVQIITEVKNSAGTRTTAPRTITIEEPIE